MVMDVVGLLFVGVVIVFFFLGSLIGVFFFEDEVMGLFLQVLDLVLFSKLKLEVGGVEGFKGLVLVLLLLN